MFFSREFVAGALTMVHSDDADYLWSHRCGVYVAQLEASASMTARASRHASSVIGVHYWLQQALKDHPWRVGSADAADIIIVNASFSATTVAEKATYDAALRELHNCSSCTRCRNGYTPPLRFAVGDCKQAECASRQHLAARFLPTAASTDDHGGPRTIWIKDYREKWHPGPAFDADASTEMLTPFVVSAPSWLVSSSGVPPPSHEFIPWVQRKLLFFSGHIPNPYHFSPLRWHLWRQLVRDPRASVYSSDV